MSHLPGHAHVNIQKSDKKIIKKENQVLGSFNAKKAGTHAGKSQKQQKTHIIKQKVKGIAGQNNIPLIETVA